MKTYLECIPCFFRQALEASILAKADDVAQKRIIDEVAKAIPDFSLEASPPEMARIIHGAVKKHTGIDDPYIEIKNKSNAMAMSVYEDLKKKINNSDNKLLKAIEIAITGNIIDFGVKNTLNVQDEIDKILQNEENASAAEKENHFEYNKFKEEVQKAETIVYLADNAGETVFDRILIEEMRGTGVAKKIYYAVKEKPIINDALIADAQFAEIDEIAEIISSGSDAPGTILEICSKNFMAFYKAADLIISKGQGNFEALSNPGRNVFYLFMAKCPVIAKDVGCNISDIILTYK